MANVQDQKDTGYHGIDLGTDPTKTRQLVVGDGARYDTKGRLAPRLGRKIVSLDYPTEQGVPGSYNEAIPRFRPGSTRGIVGMYDQRIVTEVPENLADTNFRGVEGAGWSVTGPWFIDTYGPKRPASAYFNYTGGGVTSGILSQVAATLKHAIKSDTDYVLQYHLTRPGATAVTGEMHLTTNVASTQTDMPLTVGYHNITFRSATGAITDFEVEVTTTGNTQFNINSISLKEVRVKGLDRLPQRLAFVYKSGNELHYNNDDVGGGVISSPGGDHVLESDRTRAKLISRGSEVLAADESSRPRRFRRAPADEQLYLERVKYEWRELGIRWPTNVTPTPTVVALSSTGSSTIDVANGLYRFRIVLVDKWGELSNPSLPGSVYITAGGTKAIGVDWSNMRAEWASVLPESDIRVNIYWQFTANPHSSESPSDYKLLTTVGEAYEHTDGAVTSGAGSTRFLASDKDDAPNAPLWERNNGHPPRLLDMIVVSDTIYGIAMPDTIYREVVVNQEDRVPETNLDTPFGKAILEDNTKIGEIRVDSSYFFWGRAGLMGGMENWKRFGRGSEIGVGLAEAGSNVVVLTSQAVYIFDKTIPEMRRVHSKVGCKSRDSIVETERGIRFMGSDGVPRLFNGATVEEITNEVRPIFSETDRPRYYKNFDSRYPEHVTAAFGKNIYWMNYPVSNTPGLKIVPGEDLTGPDAYNLAVARESEGRAQWAIDTSHDLHEVTWLGREARLLAVDRQSGYAYYIEEGLADETVIVSGFNDTPIGVLPAYSVVDVDIPYTFGFKWYASADGLEGQFYRFRVEADTKGNDMTIVLSVDEQQSMTDSFVVNFNGRDGLSTGLPPHYKGRYLEVRFTGRYTEAKGRPEVFNHFVEAGRRGEF